MVNFVASSVYTSISWQNHYQSVYDFVDIKIVQAKPKNK